MSRLLVCATAVCTLALVGCGSTPPDATALTSPAAAAAKQDASTDATSTPTLASNIDGALQNAHAMRARGDFDGASHILSQLMLVSPDDPRVVGEYGKVLVQRGKSQDAVAFLQRAIQLQPDDWTLYSALGVGYDQLDNRPAAKTAYEHALALKPDEPVVLNNYAVSRMLAGDYDSAQRMLARAAVNGSSYEKIGNNIQMIADMRGSKAAAAAPVAAAPVATATMAPKANHPPVSIATIAAPRTIVAKPGVVMQRVPVDPLAGPVAGASHSPRKLAADPKSSKTAAEKSPSLRTAAD